MLGNLLNTLKFRLDTEEKEWRSLNRTRGELRPGLWHRWISQIACSPTSFGIQAFALVSIFAIATAFVDPKHLVVFCVANFDNSDSIAYFSALWAVQASVAALVYPIVIAFVTILLGQKNNAKATLHIYLHDSAARLAGLSAILLILQMGIQYFFIPYIQIKTFIAWIVFDGMWFLINIVLMIHFLDRTFDFIQPSRRFEIMRRHAVNITWPREARFHLARHFFQLAVEENLLPGPSYGALQNGKPSVLMGTSILKTEKPTVSCKHRNKRQLSDIRFRLLAWATKSWLKRANLAYSLRSEEETWPYQNRDAVIAFPLDPFAIYEGDTTLCRVEGETPLSCLERFFIRHSFVFRESDREIVELTANDILMDMQAEAITFLRSGELEAFEKSINNMLALYESLLDASQLLDAKGGNTNVMQILDRNHWSARPVYEILSRHFIDLFEAASNKLSLGEDYVSSLTHTPNRLFSHAQNKPVPIILKYFIGLSPILLGYIENWWVRTIEQQGETKHSLCNPTMLRPPFYGLHDNVLREFIGAWESLKNHRILQLDIEKADWKYIQQSAECLASHLSHTVVMLFDCILRGDCNAAEWLADVLLKWYGEMQFKFRGIHDYFLHNQRLLTIEILSEDWNEVERRIEIESFGVPGTPRSSAVIAACLNNLWIDTCCIAIYVLAIWNKNCERDSSLPAHILSALVNGRPLRHGGHAVDGDKPYSNADKLLIAILRQHYVDGHYRRGYRNRLDKYVERISQLSQPEMVSGRIYTWSGSNDLDSVRDGQLLALMLTLPIEWKPSRKVESILEEWSRSENRNLREFKRMLDNWKTRLNDASFSELMESYGCLKRTVEIGSEFKIAKSSLIQAIDYLLAVSTRVRARALEDTPPSTNRLSEIGQWASIKAFDKETSAFPIPLFGRVVPLENIPLPVRSLIIKGMDKGEFTDPPMADRAVNEEEWFAETVRNSVASTVLSEILYELKPEKIIADTPEAYWVLLKKFANNAFRDGLHPVLLLENPTLPTWMWDWVHPPFDESDCSTAPADLAVSKSEGLNIDGYQWSLNDIHVFNAPLPPGSSVMVVRESFESIEFSRLPDGRFITAEPKEVEGHPEIVDLALTWQMKINIEKYPSIQLSYQGQGDRLHSGTEVRINPRS